jgi:trk system potassium uptake protein
MRVLIAGGGKVGRYLATLLTSDGHSVKVIELRDEMLPPLRRELPPASVVPGNATDPELLELAGIRDVNVVAAVTGEDETNLVITSLARFEFRVPRVIGRVNNPRNAWMYTPEMGVDVALNQADIMGRLIAEEMSLGDMMTLVKLRKGLFSVVEEKVHPRSAVLGKALRNVSLPRDSVLIAVIRKGTLILPHGDLVFEPADEVVAVVHQGSLKGFNDLLASAG